MLAQSSLKSQQLVAQIDAVLAGNVRHFTGSAKAGTTSASVSTAAAGFAFSSSPPLLLIVSPSVLYIPLCEIKVNLRVFPIAEVRARARALRSLIPPPRLKLSNWIEDKVVLPEGTSALPGRVRLWPYQREIADAISDPMIERVTLVKGVRLGFTTLLTGAIGGRHQMWLATPAGFEPAT